MHARRAGPLAAGALTGNRHGAVVAVHSAAILLRLDDGPLIALLPAGTPLHPWAIELLLAAAAFAALGPGDEARHADDRLRIGPLVVELRGVGTPDLRLARRPRALAPEPVARLARLQPAPPDPPGPFDAALDDALERFRAGGGAAALADVIGVGEGLTPSGDDLVVGALAALDLARALGPQPALERARLAAALAPAATRTTALSAQLLAAAADGCYAEPVLDVLAALADEPAGDGLERAVRGLLAVGHRSGGDLLRGMVAGLERVAGTLPT